MVKNILVEVILNYSTETFGFVSKELCGKACNKMNVVHVCSAIRSTNIMLHINKRCLQLQ